MSVKDAHCTLEESGYLLELHVEFRLQILAYFLQRLCRYNKPIGHLHYVQIRIPGGSDKAPAAPAILVIGIALRLHD